MSSYFVLEPACDTKETGPEYPQVQKMAPGYDYDAPNSVDALSRAVESFPEFIPNLDYFIVNGRANLTDLLSAAPIHGGFLISEKFKKILENFNLAPHRFYNAKVSYKKQFYQYYWMHIICNLTEFVDYSKSVFFIYMNYAHNLGYVTITSKEDYVQEKNKIKKDNPGKTITIWAEKITLLPKFDAMLDLFEIGAFDSNYYISSALKSAIETGKITGCNINSNKTLFIN